MADSFSGCLGSFGKSQLSSSLNEPLKGTKSQRGKVPKHSVSEDFWTTSTCDMDNSAFMSRGSMSSISASNLTTDVHGTNSSDISSEFVNHGLLLWKRTRQQWVGTKKSVKQADQQLREPKLSWNATYDTLLGTNKPFAQPIPLSEMVDFLVDIWEQEGMYD